MAKKMQHCFNCGEELGVYDRFPGDLDTCGKRECEKEARYQQQAERDEAAWNAQQDDYARYR
jgi:hypothetical protein